MSRSNDFFRLILPWPDWDISPNGTTNRKKRTRLTKEHKEIGYYCALESIGYENWIDADHLFSIWIFYDPDKIHRDTGNIRASMKAYQDGIFKALQLDDYAVKPEYLHRAGVKKGGEIELRLYEDYRQWIDDVVVLSSSVYDMEQS